jgi:hypothetical protein
MTTATITPIRPVRASDARSATIAPKTDIPTCDESERRTRDLSAKDRPAISMIVTRRYADAKNQADALGPGWPLDWLWFCSFDLAHDWLERCYDRGVYPETRWWIQ